MISDIMKYMFEHLSEPINADSVAKHFCISRSKLDKDFNKYTQTSFRQFLITMRLTNAVSLLWGNKLSISEIAAASGFETENHFYTQFKKREGITPLQYRKKALRHMGIK